MTFLILLLIITIALILFLVFFLPQEDTEEEKPKKAPSPRKQSAPSSSPASKPPEKTGRLVLCAGKVFYDLMERRERDGLKGVAIVRVEQLYPFDKKTFLEVIKPHQHAREILWVQEEERYGIPAPRVQHLRNPVHTG